MRPYGKLMALWLLTLLWGCSNTILVPVPPRMDLKQYGTIGLIQFTTNSDSTMNAFATQQFQEQVQGAYPGTPILELGSKDAVLAAVGETTFDAETMTKIGKKYGVSAVFIGEIVYSDPKTDIRISDITKLNGTVRTEIRGDVSGKLMETQVGASVEQFRLGQTADRRGECVTKARRQYNHWRFKSQERHGASAHVSPDRRLPAKNGPPTGELASD